MRRVVCLLGVVCLVLFLFSLSASAQEERSFVDVFAGYSFVHTGPSANFNNFNANGGVGSVAFNLTSWGAVVVEAGGVHATHIGGTNVDATAATVMAGPKISLFHRSRLSPFGQVLFGYIHSNPGFNQTPVSHNNFAMAPGVGLDWNATRHFGIRLAQVDYLFTRMPSSANLVNWNNFRYSGGVLFRF